MDKYEATPREIKGGHMDSFLIVLKNFFKNNKPLKFWEKTRKQILNF